MSTVRADNFGKRDGSSSIPADTMLQGTAKAWLNLNGTGTAATRDSFNISSITDLGVGAYNVNFAAAQPNANYARSYGAMDTTYSNVIVNGRVSTTVTVTQFGIFVSRSDNGALIDAYEVDVVVHGDPV